MEKIYKAAKISRRQLNRIISGEQNTKPTTALLISRVVGGNKDVWLYAKYIHLRRKLINEYLKLREAEE